MNKKGQIGEQVGMIIMLSIVAIVGVILFQAIAQESGKTLSLSTLTDYSLGTQTNGTTYYLDGYRTLGTVTVYGNGTDNPVELASGNYTITDAQVNPTTGALSVSILPASEYTATVWTVNTTTAQASTYVSDTGSRAIVGIIGIFFALAIAIVMLTPTLRNGLLDAIGK
jgi:hypothetical protein